MTVYYFEYSHSIFIKMKINTKSVYFFDEINQYLKQSNQFNLDIPLHHAFFLLKKYHLFTSCIIFIMGKRTKKCPKMCEKHRFILKPVHYSAVFSRELEASYCPTHPSHPSIMPKFNKDKKHYTIGFYLPVDHVNKVFT